MLVMLDGDAYFLDHSLTIEEVADRRVHSPEKRRLAAALVPQAIADVCLCSVRRALTAQWLDSRSARGQPAAGVLAEEDDSNALQVLRWRRPKAVDRGRNGLLRCRLKSRRCIVLSLCHFAPQLGVAEIAPEPIAPNPSPPLGRADSKFCWDVKAPNTGVILVKRAPSAFEMLEEWALARTPGHLCEPKNRVPNHEQVRSGGSMGGRRQSALDRPTERRAISYELGTSAARPSLCGALRPAPPRASQGCLRVLMEESGLNDIVKLLPHNQTLLINTVEGALAPPLPCGPLSQRVLPVLISCHSGGTVVL